MKTRKRRKNKTFHKLLISLTIISLVISMLAGCKNTENASSEAPSTIAEAESAETFTSTETTEESSSESSDSFETSDLSEASTPLTPLTPAEIEALYEPINEQVTVMVYLTGSDLESAAAAGTNDMREMAESGIDLSRVNLLVFTGGASKWHNDDRNDPEKPAISTIPEIPTDRNMLYRLTENGYEAVEEFDQLSMGDPANLTRFLQYSYEHFPADAYDLILWDHGNGPVIGYGSDKQYGGDSLTLREMKEALEASPFGKNAAPHLSLLGLDACLMSSAELACTVADYADYLVASQETEPSFGWNYNFLRMCGRISAQDLAKEIVRSYSEYCELCFADNEFFQSDYTLAVIDLSHAKELKESIDALFQKASDDVSGSYNRLAAARVRSHGFGRASTGSEYDLVDLESLAQQMEEKYPGEVQNLREAITKSVVTTKSNIGESCGVSIFYPYYNKNYYKKAWREEYQNLDAFPDYSTYLTRYDQVWLGADLMEVYDGELTLQQGESAGTYTLQLTPEQYAGYASSRYMILRKMGENLYTLVYISKDITDKNGLLTANFDGNVIYCKDDYGKKGIPFIQLYETVDGVTDCNCRAIARRNPEDPDALMSDMLPCDVQFAVNTGTGKVTIKGIYEKWTSYAGNGYNSASGASANVGSASPASDTDSADSTISTGKRTPVDITQWAALNLYDGGNRFLTRDEQGRIRPFAEWSQSGLLSYYDMPLANGLHFTYEPLYDDGNEYFVMFEVSDAQDNQICSELMPFTLQEMPPEELAPEDIAREANEIEWPGGSSVTILGSTTTPAPDEASGLFLELCVFDDQQYRQTSYMLHAVNHNDYGVSISLKNIYLNDTISYNNVGRNYLDAFLDPGEEKFTGIEDISSILTFSGISTIESLQFTLEVKRRDNYGYIIHGQPYYIKVTDEIIPQNYVVPILGALAGNQILYPAGSREANEAADSREANEEEKEPEIRIELLSLGDHASYHAVSGAEYFTNLLAKTKITNLSGAEQTVQLLGLEINGVLFNTPDSCTLQPGESWDKALEIDLKDLKTIDDTYADYDREELLHGISEIKLLAMVGGSLLKLPVELTKKGTQEPFEASGVLLYENDRIRVHLHSAGTGHDNYKREGRVWELWVENISDSQQDYEIYMRNEIGEDSYLTAIHLVPGTKQLVQVGCLPEEITEQMIQIYFLPQSEAITLEERTTPGGGARTADIITLSYGEPEETPETEAAQTVHPEYTFPPFDWADDAPEPTQTKGEASGLPPWVLYETEDCSIVLTDSLDPDNGRGHLLVTTVNNSEDVVRWEINNIVVDNAVRSTETAGRNCNPGETNTVNCLDIDRWFARFREDIVTGVRPLSHSRKLSFTLEICMKDSNTLQVKETIQKECIILFPDDYETKLVFDSIFSMKAEQQTLLENDNVFIELCDLGRNPDSSTYYSLTAVVRIVNRSDHSIPVDLTGIKLNGFYIDPNTVGEGRLPPGSERYLLLRCKSDDIKNAGIDRISSVELLVLTSDDENTGAYYDAGGTWYSVTLSEAGEVAEDGSRDVPVYEDEYISIAFRDSYLEWNEMTHSDPYGYFHWFLVVTNKSDENIELHLEDLQAVGEEVPESDIFNSLWQKQTEVGINSKTVIELQKKTDENKPVPAISFRVKVLTLGDGKLLKDSKEVVVIEGDEEEQADRQ